jgi:hypothetical protein
MATLTGHRSRARRARRASAPSTERSMPVRASVCAVDDPEPGPRDAADLVARFSRSLPDAPDCTGVFSLGTD